MRRKTSAHSARTVIGVLLVLMSLAQSLPNVQAATPSAPSSTQQQQHSVIPTTAHTDDHTGVHPDAATVAALDLFMSATPLVYGANGDLISFTYLITNNGSATLAGPFSIHDQKLGVISPCGAGPLLPGGTTGCTASYAITSADMNSPTGELDFMAFVDDAAGIVSPNSNLVTLKQAVRELSLLPTADRSTYSAIGDLITFKFEVKNAGNVTLAAPSAVKFATANSQLDLGLISPCGTAPLAPGATTSCTKAYAVTQTDLNVGSITIEPFAQNPGASDSCTFCNNKVTVTFAPSPAVNTTTTLVAAPNPSTRGQAVTFTAAVAAASGTPTGTVTFRDGATKLDAPLLNAGGVATLNLATLAVGAHTITAHYEGNNKFNPSTSAIVTQTVTKQDTTFALGYVTTPVALGAPFTFTVRLLPASQLQTGVVKFLHEGTVLSTAPLKDVTDPVTGVKFRGVDFITNTFPSGVHSIRARYEGDSNFNAATSALVTKTIVGPQNSTLDLKSGPNPATVGQKVTITARALPQSDRQTGNVTFFDGATALGTAPLQNGCAPGPVCREASFDATTLTAGVHILTANYGGDSNYTAATSTAVTQTITSVIVVPLTPITLILASGSKAMQLQWNVTNDPSVTTYRILRNAGVNDRFQIVADNWPNPIYTDSTNLVRGLTYCYQVEARRSNGIVAVTSNTVCKVFGSLELYVPNTLGRPGETVLVALNITNANGLRIVASDIWLDFNGAIVESVSISRTALTAGYTWDFSVQDSANPPTTTKRLRIALINLQPEALHGPGALFWLNFKVKGSAGQSSLLDLRPLITNIGGSSIQDVTNPSQDVPLQLTDGRFTVGAANAGFTLGDVDGDGVIRAKDALRALSLAVGKPAPTQQEVRAADINSNNHIDSADASMILYYAAHGGWLTPPKPSTVNASALQANATVRLNSAQGQPGQHLFITLGAGNLTEIAGGDFQVAYDPGVVKGVVNVVPTALAANFQTDFHDSGNGLLTIALSNDTAISGSDNLLTIEFELQSNAPLGASPLTLANASLNDRFGRDFVASFANNNLTRQNGTITVGEEAANALYLPLISRK